jgi:hypothetical protein
MWSSSFKDLLQVGGLASPVTLASSTNKTYCHHTTDFVCLFVFNATFNNISVISWLSILLVEETGGLFWREKPQPVTSHWQTLSYNVVHCVHLALIKIRTHNISGDRHRLHRLFKIQLPYNHDHDGPRGYSLLTVAWNNYNTSLTSIQKRPVKYNTLQN